MSWMREFLGYTATVELFAAAGLLLAAATYWIVPELQSASEKTVWADVKEVLSNGRVVATCLSAGLLVGPLEGFADVWGTVFLKKVYGFEGASAASLPSMIFIGMCFGSPLLSWLADKVGSYLGTILIAGLAMACSFFLLLLFKAPASFLTCSFFLVGVCSAYQILAIYRASNYVREEVVGLTTALANMIIMLFGYAFHSAIGAVVNALGGADSGRALFWGVAVIPAALLIGTAGFTLLFLSEKASAVRAEASV